MTRRLQLFTVFAILALCGSFAFAQAVPDPTTDPTATVSLLSHLYSTGAFFCLGIVGVFIALRYASTHVALLEKPGVAHYVTVILAVLAVFAIPAARGTTPNASMLIIAASTALTLLLPGAPTSSTSPALAADLPAARLIRQNLKAGPSGLAGRIRLSLAGALAVVGISGALALSCTHPEVVAGENAGEACGISTGESLIGNVTKALGTGGGLAAVEQAIASDSALASLTVSAINCLVSIVVAVEQARVAAIAKASPTGAVSAPNSIITNGRAWLAKHAAVAP
jgi:hypothetical protein